MLWGTVIILISLSSCIILSESRRLRRRDYQRFKRNILNDNKCLYPCTCPTKDVCSKCEECPRQLGEPCSVDRPCDQFKGYVCTYLHEGETEGICKESIGIPCIVYNRTYQHGETFSTDCRTQCACQNGTYGCSSLCPQEHISPKGTCKHPRLVDVPGQCCREWMCDGQAVEQPPSCQATFSKWSDCSNECGIGLSTRRSNLNSKCESTLETRICQTRRCFQSITSNSEHHLRKGHECKATHRLSAGTHLRFGPCISRKRFRPKFCGSCPLPDVECRPLLSTTVRVEFYCNIPNGYDGDDGDVILPEFVEIGEDLWTDDPPNRNGKLVTILVQWVLKCSCKHLDFVQVLHRVHRTATLPLN